jgi:hypothetical protein
VVHGPEDLGFAEAMAAAAQVAGNQPALLLQPGWNSQLGQELSVNFIKAQPTWRLSLQSHKQLGVR